MNKKTFENKFSRFCKQLQKYVSDNADEWTIKGFIDVNKNIFSLSGDTKIISKILEIHIFPKIVKFAKSINFDLVLADHQNYYPDMSLVFKNNKNIKYAVDIKTTYRDPRSPDRCGFTLGSHGEYFINRSSTKNIQFPYKQYKAHFVLGIIYTRNKKGNGIKVYKISKLAKINSVIKDIQFFFVEKWKIAGETQGSGNTANIGSVTNISDLAAGAGPFVKYGEAMFDDYWQNYGKITISDGKGGTKKIRNLKEFLKYRGIKE